MDTFDKNHNRLFIFIILTVFFNCIIFIVRFHKNVVYCSFNLTLLGSIYALSELQTHKGPFGSKHSFSRGPPCCIDWLIDYLLKGYFTHFQPYLLTYAYSPTLGIGHEQELSRHPGPGPFSPAVPMCGQISSHLHPDHDGRCFVVCLSSFCLVGSRTGPI